MEVKQATDKQVLADGVMCAGGTNTALALHHARTQGLAAAREDAARVIILLTDGQSENATQALQEAREAREEGMAVFAVGIGSHTDMVELMGVASDPDENFVFRVDSFGGLENIRELLAIKTCDGKLVKCQASIAGCEFHCTPTIRTCLSIIRGSRVFFF